MLADRRLCGVRGATPAAGARRRAARRQQPIDPRRLQALPGRFGGHGLTPHVAPPGAASYHDAAYYGSHGAVWHYMRHWVAPLRHASLCARAGGLLPYQAAVQASWQRIRDAHANVVAVREARPHLLPSAAQLPALHDHLLDGRFSPATVPLGSDAGSDAGGDDGAPVPSALALFHPDIFDSVCHTHAQRAASAVIASMMFTSLYDSSDLAGRARLLDGSTPRGPFTLWHRVPVAPAVTEQGHIVPLSTAQPFFAFEEPSHFPVALALDLLTDPELPNGSGPLTVCTAPACAAAPVVEPDVRHCASCTKGHKLGAVCHDPTVHALASILDAIYGSAAVHAERGRGTRGHQTVAEWMQHHPGVNHSPDIVLRTAHGRYTLIDIKTLDVTAATHLATNHTHRQRLSAHADAAEKCRRDEYGALPDIPGTHLRLVVIVVSTTGSISAGGSRFVSELSRRTGGSVPSTLLDQSSWAVPRLGPFVRTALAFAARRGLAAQVASLWAHADDDDPRIAAAAFLAGQPPPPAPSSAAAPSPHAGALSAAAAAHVAAVAGPSHRAAAALVDGLPGAARAADDAASVGDADDELDADANSLFDEFFGESGDDADDASAASEYEHEHG